MNGMARTLVDMLDEVTQRRADQTAFIYLPDGQVEADSVTFGQLHQRAQALAARLTERSLTGQRAILSLPPGTDFVVALAGCFLAGVTAVPVVPEPNSRHRRPKLQHIVADCSPAVELTSLEAGTVPTDGRETTPPYLLVDDIDLTDAAGFTPVTAKPEDLAILQYTSGSTSSPRGVMVSHRNVLANLAMLREAFDPGAHPTVNWLPLHHDMGLFGNVLRCLYSGATCVLMPPTAFLRRPLRWLQAIDKYQAFVSGGPNFAYDMCVRRTTEAERAALDLSSWKTAFNGAEPVRPETLERFATAFAPAGFAPTSLAPGYGLAEATLLVSIVAIPDRPTIHNLSAEALRDGDIVAATGTTQDITRQVACGRPSPGIEVALVDPTTRKPVPAGRIGEIWLRGDSIAGGYWNRPKESAEVFGARLARAPKSRKRAEGPYLRTGDLGALINGELVITGRIKDLIIIRGANYYPQDIEYTVRDSLPAEQAGVTAVFAEEHNASERLVVVQEIRSPQLDPQLICDDIHKQVMVNHGLPIHRLVLVNKGQLPRTSSGKIQRSLCRQMLTEGRLSILHDDNTQTTDTDMHPPMDDTFLNDIRDMLAALVRRPAQAISFNEPLAAARVDSLAACELQEQLRDRFAVEVELTTLLGARTLREIAETVYAATKAPTAATAERAHTPADTGSPLDPFPLTALQEAYLAGRTPGFELSGVGTHAYLEYQHHNLDVPRAVEAWRRTVHRHDMLRAVITPDGKQRILPKLAEPIHVDDLRDHDNPEDQVLATRQRMSHQVLDPYRGPLFEIRLSPLPGGHTIIHLSFDLLVLDATGVLRVLHEWGRHYQGTGEDTPVAGPSFRDFVLAHHNRHRDTERIAQQLRTQLANLHPGPALPLAQDPATLGTPTFRRRSAPLDAHTWHRLQTAAHTRGVTPAALLGAAFSEVLARYSQQQPFTLTVTSFTRPTGQVGPEVVGEFTTLLLVPVAQRCPDFDTRLRDFSHALATALQNRDIDGVMLLRERARNAATGQPPRPLAPVVFTCLAGETDLGWLGEQRHAISQTPQVWLDHQVLFTNGSPELIWDAVEELFPAGLLDAMFDTYQRLLHNLCEHSSWHMDSARLAGLDTLATRPETPTMPGADQTLNQLVEAQIERTPNAEAIISAGRRISYRQLGTANRLVAAALLRHGMRPGDLAIIALPKGWEQIPAVLGTLTAGGVYVPVDPDVTDARMRQLLDDSTAQFILTTTALAASRPWASAVRCIPVDQLWPDGLDQPAPQPPRIHRQPDDLAYLIYTSGSTGKPKGVAIEHRGAANTVLDINDQYAVGPADKILGVTPLTFDLSVYDIFGPLSAGACLVLPEHQRRGEPDHWIHLLRQEGVTLWNSVPSLLRLLVEDPAAADLRWAQRLRLLLLSGDWIGVDFAARLRRDLPQARLISLGGATEGSIWSVSYEVDQVDPTWRSVPYGTGMRGQDAIVLDAHLEPQPPLVPGPLYLAGAGLAREYWKDPDKTSASFVIHPSTGRRLYRTGDLARLRADGNLELLGREDNQLKVQGHRIEPGEVEAALANHPAVIDAVVGAVGPRDDVRRLVACVRLHPTPAVTTAQLREHVAAQLPRYLVPDSIRVVDTFPLTNNGKLDRRALFDPTTDITHDPAPDTSTPTTAPEHSSVRAAVLRSVAIVSGEPEVTAQTRFSELEFTSVHLIRLANALEVQLGSRPRLDALYQMSLVEDLVSYYLSTTTSAAEQAPSAPQPRPTPMAAGVLADPDQRSAFKQRHHNRPAPAGIGVVVNLPGANDPLDKELLDRRTASVFAPEQTPVTDLAAWIGCLRQQTVDGRTRRAWGSAGGIYPVEVYLQINDHRVLGLAAGVYYYDSRSHTLSLLASETLIHTEHHTTDNQRLHQQAALEVFLVADLDAITPLYGELSERFCLLEAGSMGHLLETRAPRHNLATRQIGVLDFSLAATRLGLRAGQKLVYSLLVGRPDAAPAASTDAGRASTPNPATPPPATGSDHLNHPHQAVPAARLHPQVHAHTTAKLHQPRMAAAQPQSPQAFLVTGGTGFLGAYLISELLRRTDATVYGLVRAADSDTATQRLHRALRRYGRPATPQHIQRLTAVPGDLSKHQLGLPAAHYNQLSETVDTVVHSAAEVTWTSSYQQLAATNVLGTRRIIDFTAERHHRSLVHVSTVAVFPFGGDQPVTEDDPLDHNGLLYGGYPHSKWVAEQVVRRAAADGLPVTVMRPGTITGDSITGAYNPASFLDLFLVTCIQLGWAPNMDMPLDMTPADYAAAAAVSLITQPEGPSGTYHLTHPAPARLSDVYDLIEACGHRLRREPFDSWQRRLLEPQVITGAGLAPFAGFLAHAREEFLRMPPYHSCRTLAALPPEITCPPMDQRLINTYLTAYVRSGYLSPAGHR